MGDGAHTYIHNTYIYIPNLYIYIYIYIYTNIYIYTYICVRTGGLLEAVADQHKTNLKRKDPNAIATTGSFRLCRHPSYLGEVNMCLCMIKANHHCIGSNWLVSGAPPPFLPWEGTCMRE